MFETAQRRLAGALVVAVSAACGAEDGVARGVPRAWLEPGEWWVLATVIEDDPEHPAAAIAGVSTPLRTARFEVDFDRAALRASDGALVAAWPARTRGDRVEIDWGGSVEPQTLAPGWIARPEPAKLPLFGPTDAAEAVRLGPVYVEWTVPATIEGADAAELGGGSGSIEGARLRFSAVPAATEPFERRADEHRRFRFASGSTVPRLRLTDPSAGAWPSRTIRPTTIEAAPGLPFTALEAVREATRRVAREIEEALVERGVTPAAQAPLVAVPSRCSVARLARAARERPDLADGIRSRLCPEAAPLCVVETAGPAPRTLEAACRYVAAAEWDADRGTTPFEWARAGDLRFHRAGLTVPGSPFAIVASSAVTDEGQIVRVGLRVNAASPLAAAERVGTFVDRILTPHPDDGPRPEEIIGALEWASMELQVGLRERADTGFVARLAARTPLPELPVDPRTRARPVAEVAGERWSADAFSDALRRLTEGEAEPRAARWMNAGLHPDDIGALGSINLAVRFGTAGAEEARRQVRARLDRQRWLSALLLGLGLQPNPAGSADALNLDRSHELTASVLDRLPLLLRTELVDLAPYDRAALRLAYADQVWRFASDVPEISAIAAFLEDNGPVGLLGFLCGGCTDPATALEVFATRRFEPRTDDRAREVPFWVCDPQRAERDDLPHCRWNDWGTSLAHSLAFDLALFRSEAWVHDRTEAWRRVLRTGRIGAARASSTPPSSFTPAARSGAAAAAMTINAVLEVALRPEAGARCRRPEGLMTCEPGEDPTLYVGRSFARFDDTERLVQEGLLYASARASDGSPGAPFVKELAHVAALAAAPSPGRVSWCPDVIGRLERGRPRSERVLDPSSGRPMPFDRCDGGAPLLDPVRAVDLGPVVDLMVTIGAGVEPSLGVVSDPAAEDCTFEVDGEPFGSTMSDGPWVDIGCHVLAGLADGGDAAAAHVLVDASAALDRAP